MSNQLLSILSSIHQETLYYSLHETQQQNLLSDLLYFNSIYPGGIKEYMDRISSLLSSNPNSFSKYVSIDIPLGKDLNFGTSEFEQMETVGLNELQSCCFAIVGGGIGERLGSSQPKLCLTSNLITNQSFLGFYFSYFHAIEIRFHCKIPVVIMTSQSTHSAIQEELEKENYYGLDKEYVFLLPQIEVPAIWNSSCQLALQEDGHLIFKPHGHGDIHTLLYQNHLPSFWKQLGKKYILFMQDTNILAIYGFAALLGVAVTQQLDFASLGIVRKPGEKVGSICRLEDESGRQITCNIEYNEFETLLQEVNGVADEANENGNSSYPGNINVLCVSISSYINTLQQTQGIIPEFINPKYIDETKQSFQSPARLECMMQDLPKIMNQKMNIGYCSLPRWLCFSAAKNNEQNASLQEKKTGYGESMYSMEEDYYKFFRKVLRESGILIGQKERDEAITSAVGIPSTPIIILSPQSALTSSEMKSHFSGFIEMKSNAILYLDGMNIHLRDVVIDGTLLIHTLPNQTTILEKKLIHNKGWKFISSSNQPLRKYTIQKIETDKLIDNQLYSY